MFEYICPYLRIATLMMSDRLFHWAKPSVWQGEVSVSSEAE